MEETKKTILIIGCDGMLGRAVLKEFTGHYPVIGTSINDLDITDTFKLKQVITGAKPWFVIHTAAFTDVDGCEDKPELAYEVNALAARNIAKASNSVGAGVIYLSSDYVFDGTRDKPYTEDLKPNPLSVYGRTKLEGEIFLAQELENFIIIRSSWLYGRGKIGFVEKIIKQAESKKAISVVADKYGSPTYVKDLSRAILEVVFLAEKVKSISPKSILHITNSGFCSWVEYAEKIIEFSGIKGVAVKSISPEEFNFKAKRPRFSVLDNSKYNKLSGKPLRPWQDALKEYLQCSKN